MPASGRSTLTRRALIACLLLVGTLPGAWAEPASDGLALLRRVADTYRRAERFHLVGEIHASLTSAAGTDSSSATFVAASGGKGRLRDELDVPGSGMMRVSDGSKSWIYVGQLGQWQESPEPIATPEMMDSIQVREIGGILGSLLNAYRGIADGADSVKVLRAESVRLGKISRLCDVVRARYANADGAQVMLRTYWIERARGVVLRQRTSLRSTVDGAAFTRSEMLTFRQVSIGEPVPDAVFTFQPPAGAIRVDHLPQAEAEESGLTGQEAADFSLDDLEGRTHRLSEQRGKVVMLDFWATWCGPCRRQMPAVDRLYREFKDKGLVVYAVNQGESADRARAYLQKFAYTTTTLLDSRGEVGRQYEVRGIPTLVIVDREGKIVAHWVGVHPENMLRDGLKRAGIE